MAHGVLGPRWAYDGTHDPVLRTALLALFEGRTQAQAQSLTDTPDHEVTHSYPGPALPTGPAEVTEDQDGTELTLPDGTVLRVHRRPRPTTPEGTAGHVSGAWVAPDGTRTRAVFATLSRP